MIRCGHLPSAVTLTYPEDSIQSLVSPDPSWWVSSEALTRGSLVWAIVPYPEQKPFRLVPVGRGQDARQHAQAEYRLEEFRVGGATGPAAPLPVAALPSRGGEEYLVRRGKRRPCLILASTDIHVDASVARGKRWQTALTRLVVPYYSANGTTARAGWSPKLVTRIRRCTYPQYFWEDLPVPGAREGSILRFDHAFAIGHDPANVQQTRYRLHQDSLDIMDDWFAWYLTGKQSETISLARELFSES